MADEETVKNEVEEAEEVAEKAADAVQETQEVVEEKAEEKKETEKPAATSTPTPAPAASTSASGESALSNLSSGAWIGIAVAALVVGLLLGMFVFGGNGGGGQLGGKLSVSESALDTNIASYSGAASGNITVREVILQQSSLDAAKDENGEYVVPSADSVLSVARNSIILADAKKRGISASDEDVAAYAEETLGSSDYASIASSYSMDEDSVVELLTNSCIMSKLRDEIVPTDDSAAAMPEAPAEPEAAEGEEPDTNAKTKEYAEYIISLAGDEWDADADTWASTDGPYASALAGYEVSAKDGASYDAASEAYYVAYQMYSESASSSSSAWSDYVNELLSNSSITINTMVA